MAGIKLDNVIFTTAFEAYKNSATQTAPISIPADVVPNGSTFDYTASIPYDVGAAIRADTYLDGNSVKILANASTRLQTGGVYQFKSSETASSIITYYDNSIDVTLSVFNGTGGAITLTAQTITVIVVEYDAPLTAI